MFLDWEAEFRGKNSSKAWNGKLVPQQMIISAFNRKKDISTFVNEQDDGTK